MSDLDSKNAEFWSEPCGSRAADLLNLDLENREELAKFDEWYFQFYPYLKKYLDAVVHEDDICLEVGVGLGSVSRFLSERVHELHLLDIAPKAMEFVHSSLAENEKITPIVGSVLEFQPEKKYDSIVAIGSLHHTGDLDLALRNLEGALKENGKILIMVYHAFQPRRMLKHPLKVFREFLVSRFSNAEKFIFTEDDIAIRGAADSNIAGEPAPYTAFSSRLLFIKRNGMQYEVELNNSHRIPILGRFLDRETHLKLFAKFFGCDIYAIGEKSSPNSI